MINNEEVARVKDLLHFSSNVASINQSYTFNIHQIDIIVKVFDNLIEELQKVKSDNFLFYQDINQLRKNL